MRKLRISLALLLFVAVTLLFLDFTGLTHAYLGWVAEVQLVPAVLALNVGIVVILLLLTLFFGRIYCSVICPLGVLQDIFARLGRKAKRNRYTYSKPKTLLRVVMLLLFVGLMLAGLTAWAALIAPYSAFGRMATNLLQPLWMWGNNLLAMGAEWADSYAFYRVEVLWRGWISLGVAVVTLFVVGFMAWRHGRTWCNTICPVGTVLGFVARFAWWRPTIDHTKCNGCGRCARNCKAACIDSKGGRIDQSRCVVCFDCLDNCPQGAIGYLHRSKQGGQPNVEAQQKQGAQPKEGAPLNVEAQTKVCVHGGEKQSKGQETVAQENRINESQGVSRRAFLSVATAVAATGVVEARRKKVDGGVAAIVAKQPIARGREIVPPGARSLRHLTQHCTACQLCISVCPNRVLKPSAGLMRLMQPTMSYQDGYCRVECTRCSEVCPTEAIRLISREEKSSIAIGYAVWLKQNCLAAVEGVQCDNCAHHCPTGAITMVQVEGYERPIPTIDRERCIGCGACEYLCPSRPWSGIYVEGNDCHREL